MGHSIWQKEAVIANRRERLRREMEERKKLCGYYNYTVVLTYLGMLMGFTGIVLVTEGKYREAVICLMISALCHL